MLFAALYLGWLLQACFLQQNFDYIHVAPALLGLTFLGGRSWLRDRPVLRIALLTPCLLLVVMFHPLRDARRLARWPDCWTRAGSAELRDALSLSPRPEAPSWVELESLAADMRALGIQDGELTCCNESCVPLYLQLGIEPSTRFVMLESTFYFYPGRAAEIEQELRDSRQRFIVSDLRRTGISREAESDSERALLPESFPPRWQSAYPWDTPIVRRHGRYVLHRSDAHEVHRFSPEAAVVRVGLGWHALRYSEGRGDVKNSTPFGVPQGVPPSSAREMTVTDASGSSQYRMPASRMKLNSVISVSLFCSM